jgi:hypothetical protein
VREAYQSRVGCSRNAWSWNARTWRKAVYRETWSTVDGPYDEQIEQCGFACLCDIAAKSAIKERRDHGRETLICGALDYAMSDEAGRFWCGSSTEQ